jgi:hypothetical protein
MSSSLLRALDLSSSNPLSPSIQSDSLAESRHFDTGTFEVSLSHAASVPEFHLVPSLLLKRELSVERGENRRNRQKASTTEQWKVAYAAWYRIPTVGRQARILLDNRIYLTHQLLFGTRK